MRKEKMPTCELCGTEDSLVSAVVEGTTLKLCRRCKEFGDVIEIAKPKVAPHHPIKPIREEPEEIVVNNYSALVKEAREKLNLTQKDLAAQINEKESIIHKIESGHMKPPPDIARKLEHFLGIKLIEQYTEQEKFNIDFKDKSLTIGDLIRLKEKKQVR